MSVRVQVFRTDDGGWAARWVAANNKQIARTSETYQNKGDAISAVELVTGLRYGPQGKRLGNPRRLDGGMRVEVED